MRGDIYPGFGWLAAAVAVCLGASAACAQSGGPDEAVQPDGTVTQTLALTAAQRSAITNAILGQRVKPQAARLAAVVGTAVPPSVILRDLPDQPATDPDAMLLKYAMVQDDVVVVDPVTMRVVDVIHNGPRP